MSTINNSDVIYLATNNKNKIKELNDLVAGRWSIKPAKEVCTSITWEETGSTFEANANIKIDALKLPSTKLILGEDSGLCVDYLNGAPGLFSARYAGEQANDEDNLEKLLLALKDVPFEQRTAHYICCLVFQNKQGLRSTFVGRLHGHILEHRKGQGGFGYDPIFQPLGFSKSLAQLPAEEKNKISHRALAFKQWLESI